MPKTNYWLIRSLYFRSASYTGSRDAVRNTKDVDLLIRMSDLSAVTEVLEAVGFIHQQVHGIDLYLDGPDGSVRSAIHVVFSAEKVFPNDFEPTPEVIDFEVGPSFRVPTLDALVRMKLTAFRLKDKVHVLDMLGVGLIDESWCDRLPKGLATRLMELIESGEETL